MPELNEVLQTVVKMINFIKSKPLKSKLFNQLCSAMDSEHTQLLFHTEDGYLVEVSYKDFMNLEKSYYCFLLVKNQNMLIFSVMIPGVPK